MATRILLEFIEHCGEQYVRVVDIVAMLDEGASECARLIADGDNIMMLPEALTTTASYVARAAMVAKES